MRKVFSELSSEELRSLEVALKKIGKRAAALMELRGCVLYARANALASSLASADELFSVGLGDLTNKLGPAHVHGAVNLAGLRSRIVP